MTKEARSIQWELSKKPGSSKKQKTYRLNMNQKYTFYKVSLRNVQSKDQAILKPSALAGHGLLPDLA
jgi:hypothetical protein